MNFLVICKLSRRHQKAKPHDSNRSHNTQHSPASSSCGWLSIWSIKRVNISKSVMRNDSEEWRDRVWDWVEREKGKMRKEKTLKLLDELRSSQLHVIALIFTIMTVIVLQLLVVVYSPRRLEGLWRRVLGWKIYFIRVETNCVSRFVRCVVEQLQKQTVGGELTLAANEGDVRRVYESLTNSLYSDWRLRVCCAIN